MAGKSKSKKSDEKIVRITLVKSPIGYPLRQKRTVKALGLRKMNQTVEQKDTDSVRGMIHSVRHLLSVEEQDPS